MVSFALTIESNDIQSSSPGDIIEMLRQVADRVRACETTGSIRDRFGEVIGHWSYDISEGT
jgi:hypothetical protein